MIEVCVTRSIRNFLFMFFFSLHKFNGNYDVLFVRYFALLSKVAMLWSLIITIWLVIGWIFFFIDISFHPISESSSLRRKNIDVSHLLQNLSQAFHHNWLTIDVNSFQNPFIIHWSFNFIEGPHFSIWSAENE